MNLQRLSFEHKLKIVEYIGKIYQKEMIRSRIICKNEVSDSMQSYVNENDFIHFIHQILNVCSDDTVRIIRHDYLEVFPRNWYYNYYAKSSYYRLRKEAVEEFVRCLDI